MARRRERTNPRVSIPGWLIALGVAGGGYYAYRQGWLTGMGLAPSSSGSAGSGTSGGTATLPTNGTCPAGTTYWTPPSTFAGRLPSAVCLPSCPAGTHVVGPGLDPATKGLGLAGIGCQPNAPNYYP